MRRARFGLLAEAGVPALLRILLREPPLGNIGTGPSEDLPALKSSPWFGGAVGEAWDGEAVAEAEWPSIWAVPLETLAPPGTSIVLEG